MAAEEYDSNRFEAVLIFDVMRSMERAEESDHPADQRDLIRTIFACMEGLVWGYKDYVTGIALQTDDLQAIEREALEQRTFFVDGSGMIKEQARFLSMTAMLRLVTRIAERMNPMIKIDFGDTGWDSLRKAIRIRNRITHPKVVEDLIVGQADIDVSFEALHWVMKVTLVAMNASVKRLQQFTDDLRAFHRALKQGDERALKLYEQARSEMPD